jgi:hypothetical protein
MIIREYFKTRNDGVKLYKTIDAVVDEHGNPVRDENGNLIPTGKMIMQVQTGVEYSEAIDVENASYVYVETEHDIESVNDIKEETQ